MHISIIIKLKDLVFILKKEKKSENNMNHFFNYQTTFPSQEDICDNLKMEEEKKVRQKKVINQKNKCL